MYSTDKRLGHQKITVVSPTSSGFREKRHYRRLQGRMLGCFRSAFLTILTILAGSSRGNRRQYRTIWDCQYGNKYYRQLPPRGKLGPLALKVSVLALLCELPAHEIDRVGEDVLLHLFTGTSIFTPLPNECYCQVTGEHIFNLAQIPPTPSPSPHISAKRKANGEGEASRPPKQRKLDSSGKSKKYVFPFGHSLNRLDLPADGVPLTLRYRVFHSFMPALMYCLTILRFPFVCLGSVCPFTRSNI